MTKKLVLVELFSQAKNAINAERQTFVLLCEIACILQICKFHLSQQYVFNLKNICTFNIYMSITNNQNTLVFVNIFFLAMVISRMLVLY